MNPPPHVIRLDGPWEYEIFSRPAAGEPGAFCAAEETTLAPVQRGRARLPEEWNMVLGEPRDGRVRLSRSFHQPTNLEERDEVWLVIERVDRSARVWLNEEILSGFDAKEVVETEARGPGRWEIKGRLNRFNRLVIELFLGRQGDEEAATAAAGGLLAEAFSGVRLEIVSR